MKRRMGVLCRWAAGIVKTQLQGHYGVGPTKLSGLSNDNPDTKHERSWPPSDVALGLVAWYDSPKYDDPSTAKEAWILSWQMRQD
jgi:hypothetical protein